MVFGVVVLLLGLAAVLGLVREARRLRRWWYLLIWFAPCGGLALLWHLGGGSFTVAEGVRFVLMLMGGAVGRLLVRGGPRAAVAAAQPAGLVVVGLASVGHGLNRPTWGRGRTSSGADRGPLAHESGALVA